MRVLPIVSLLLVPFFVFAAESELPTRYSFRLSQDDSEYIQGGNAHRGRVVADTVVLMGPWSSGAPYNGQFETQDGLPAWNGWVSHDLTVPEGPSNWHVSDYMADNLNGHGAGNLAAWCGSLDYIVCDPEDVTGGYGNNWIEILQWTGTVPDPTQPCLVQLDAWLNSHTEPDYDFCYVSVAGPGPLPVDYWTFAGILENHHLQLEFTCPVEDFTGPNADQIVLQIRFESDGAWSDADCMFPSAGAIQIDDITVSLNSGAVVTFDDFESGLGNWEPTLPVGVGDFAKIWTNLGDSDPCSTNPTPQLAFIDDGLVVPGTGGTTCLEWCYGPGGYIVNNTGGLAGDDHYLRNYVYSPVIAWPGSQYDGCELAFDVFRHSFPALDSPGISELWSVRSTSSSDPADIENAGWMDRDSGVRMGGPSYSRAILGVSDLLEPDPQYVQMMLGAFQIGYNFGWDGPNGTPAPYFDNARITAYGYYGPVMRQWYLMQASDNFPASGQLNLQNLGSNSVRFDAIRDMAYYEDPRMDPGDSLFCDIEAMRDGAELLGTPRLYYKLKANPVFDPYRTSGLPDEGFTAGWRPMGSNGEPIPWGFAFDLPDTGFFFPGDVIHYFIAATDAIDGADVQTNHVPVDTSGFSDFSHLSIYDRHFTVRALPSVRPSETEPGQYEIPEILFWQRVNSYGEDPQHWPLAFTRLGLLPGQDFDIYHTYNSDNTLASRASTEQLASYGGVLFSGGRHEHVLGHSDLEDIKGDDLGLLENWLHLGDKNILFTGNQLATGLNEYPVSQAFMTQWLGVGWEAEQLRPLIGNQFVPLVVVEPGNPVFTSVGSWHVEPGCQNFGYNSYDAVTAIDPAGRLAQYADPAGLPGAYPYSAATLNQVPQYNANIISLPYDLEYVMDNPGQKEAASPAARARLLGDILTFFGVPFEYENVTDVPASDKLTVSHYPNPFNPRTTISFDLPREGLVSLKVFDVRGGLVRELLREEYPSGTHEVIWNGNDGTGAAVSSGLYFYELRGAGQVKVGKMTLVR